MESSLAGCWLYGILDLGYTRPGDLAETTRLMVGSGVDILQLRAKNHQPEEVAEWARLIHPITKDAGVPLVINDHAEVARDVEAEGLHVGQDDRSLTDVRAVVGENCFVGKSTHSCDQAAAAVKEGADYIGFGPLFSTPTKPDYKAIGLEEIRWVHDHVPMPVFCIGGIKKENLTEVMANGARRVVIVSGILQASDIPAYVRSVKSALTVT